jgi:MFS family permease
MSMFKIGLLIRKRDFLVSTFLFFVFYTSYFVYSSLIPKYIISSDYVSITQATSSFVIALTFMVSMFFVDGINKLKLICISLIGNGLMTILLFVSNGPLRMLFFLALGVFVGLGFLGFLTYFSKLTVVEERGRVSGVLGFVALPLSFVVDYLIAPGLNFLGVVLLSSFLSLGIMLVFFFNWNRKVLPAKNEERKYPEKKAVFLYSIPWLIFCLVNVTLAKNVTAIVSLQVSSQFYLSLIALQVIGVILGCLIGGLLADWFGRRLSLALSLTLYGIGTALIGILPDTRLLAGVYTINGFSWGILFTLYIFVIWSDLANKENCAKMYGIGLAIYYMTLGIGFIVQVSLPLMISSLLACLLVFLSNIPLSFAPELQSLYLRELMKIKLHLNTLKKIGKKSKN